MRVFVYFLPRLSEDNVPISLPGALRVLRPSCSVFTEDFFFEDFFFFVVSLA